VRCERARLALSADLDGEPLGVSAMSMHGHVVTCPGCAAWYEAVTRVTRAVRLAPAEPVPDLAPVVLQATQTGLARSRRLLVARAALAGVGLVQAMLAWPAIVLGQDPLTGVVHDAHETGAWNLALAVAFLGAATRPMTAGALVAPLGTFVAVLAVLGVLDAISGAVTLSRLAVHLVALAGVGLLVLLRRLSRPGHGTPDRRWRRPGVPHGAGPVLVPAPAGSSARPVSVRSVA
jgi:predicted anti-sigma-YlaC factor YlaD